jgi:hypothetical protein
MLVLPIAVAQSQALLHRVAQLSIWFQWSKMMVYRMQHIDFFPTPSVAKWTSFCYISSCNYIIRYIVKLIYL